MVLFEDTRNQPGKHENIHRYCDEQDIRIIRQALCVGDYMISNVGDISIDTKQNVMELAGNVFQDHERFRAECVRAQECGIRLIVLTEEELPGGRLDRWRPPAGLDVKFSPVTLRKAMITMQQEYGVRFRFCRKEQTGRTLIDYLKGDKV